MKPGIAEYFTGYNCDKIFKMDEVKFVEDSF